MSNQLQASSIIVVAYNERSGIAHTITELCRTFARMKTLTHEALMVEDGQVDGTTIVTPAMLTNDYLVAYMLVNYHPWIRQSQFLPIRDTVNFMQLVARIALYFTPLKILLPLSALLMLFAIGWALFGLLVLGQLADVSTLVIAMSGLQVGIIGLLAERINKRVPNAFRGE